MPCSDMTLFETIRAGGLINFVIIIHIENIINNLIFKFQSAFLEISSCVQIKNSQNEISERFSVNVAKMNSLIREYKEFKKDKIKAKHLKIQKKILKKEIRRDWKTWVYLSNAVMRA